MSNNPNLPERILANQILTRVVHEGLSLTEALQTTDFAEANTAFVKELCFGVLRYYERLNFYLNNLLQKPLKEKDNALHIWLLLGLYQLAFMRIPDHAVVNEMVKLTPKLVHESMKNLVNAILRNFLRQRSSLDKAVSQDAEAYFCMPKWLLQRVESNWPLSWEKMAETLMQQAPMTLRVNVAKMTRDAYLELLTAQSIKAKALTYAPQALVLDQAVPVETLPGFEEGMFSVQDAGAQLAAPMMDLQEGMQVLDACAAPGGKTTHMLELAKVKMLALDISAKRLTLVQQNLSRLGFDAEIMAENIKAFAQNYQGPLFDRILLDVPCSAVGVINRHPDIKRHRTKKDIAQLLQEQAAILDAVWPLLKIDGILIYSTCSVLKSENELQLAAFLEKCPNAKELPLHLGVGHKTNVGWQLLPNQSLYHDGFYYCKITKTH